VRKKSKISCLPIAGIGNPYQHLMMIGLRAGGAEVIHGKKGKIFTLLSTVIVQRPNYLHVDWLHQYYLRRKAWMTWLFFPLFFMEILLLKTFTSTKLVWTLHNIYPHDKPQHGPYKWARQWFAYHCDWIRVFDEGTVERASKSLNIPKQKFRIIPEGSYVAYYANNIDKDNARKTLQLPLNKRILLYLGLIKPYKGILEMVKSFQACAKNEDAILLITGKAMNLTYLQILEQAIKNDNIYLQEQFVADDALQVYFNAADVAVLPFERIENSGSAILAMGFAKPIIAPARGVLTKRLFQQPELLYKDQSIPSSILEKAILLTDQEIESIGEKNFQALNQFKWEDFASYFN